MGLHVRLTQSGGFAGLTTVADVDIDDLPADDAARVRQALTTLSFRRERGRTAHSAARPDRFQYDLEVTDGRRRSLTAHDPDLPPELQSVIDVLLPLARPE